MSLRRPLSVLSIAACLAGSVWATPASGDAPAKLAARPDAGCDPTRAEKLLFDAQDWTRRVAGHDIALCAADAGDPAGQYLLSISLWHGLGAARDAAASLRWLERAVAQGHPPALVRLAGLLLLGIPDEVEADAPRGEALLKQAAQSGSLESMVVLGDTSIEGEGLARDDRAAARWYLMAAQRGSPLGQLRYADLAAKGRGMPQDAAACFLYAALAANRNVPRASSLALACQARLTRPVRERVRNEIELWQPLSTAH